MAESIERRIAALAKRQRGYILRRELLAIGLGAKAVDYRVTTGRLIPEFAGVYAVGHRPTLPQDRAYGALLACGEGAVLSHRSAAAVWGIFKRWEQPFEVTAPSRHRRAGIRIHQATLTCRDVTTQIGLPVTSPARTVLDMAPRLADKALARAVNDLRRAGYLHLADLSELLRRHPRNAASKRLRPFVERRTGPTRSEFEDAFLAFAERFGLPQPLVNTHVAGFEVDALFPGQRVIVELDGWSFHSSRESFIGDRDRDAELLARGYRTVRLTWERLNEAPEREAARLRAILALAA
jgi:hypothetical protein